MSEDQGMVRAVLAGEREAYRRLMEKYRGVVFTAIARVVGFRPEVEDLVQETFWQAYRALGLFRGEARFSTWLLRIAMNKAIDFHRRRREESLSLEEFDREVNLVRAADQAPEKIILAKEQKERLYRHLERLPSYYRQALKRHYLDGFTYREMACEAGVPVKTIESRLYRARKLLRAMWNEEERGEAAQGCRA